MSATPSEATHADYLETIKRTSPGYWRCRRALSGPADRFDDRTTYDRGHGCTEPARVPALAGEILARTTARFRGSCWSDTDCALLARARSLEHTETTRSTAPKKRWLRLEDQPSATALLPTTCENATAGPAAGSEASRARSTWSAMWDEFVPELIPRGRQIGHWLSRLE